MRPVPRVQNFHVRVALAMLAVAGLVPGPSATAQAARRTEQAPPARVEVLAAGASTVTLAWTPGGHAGSQQTPLRIAIPAGHALRLEDVRLADGTDVTDRVAPAVGLGGVGWWRLQAFQEVSLDEAALPGDLRGQSMVLRFAFALTEAPLPITGAALGLADADIPRQGEPQALPAAPPLSEGALRDADALGAPLVSHWGSRGLFANGAAKDSRPSSLEAARRALRGPRVERGLLQRRTPSVSGAAPVAGVDPLRGPPRAAGLDGGRVRLLISSTGVYRISHALLAAAGVDLASARAAELRLMSRRGGGSAVEIAIDVLDVGGDGTFGPGDHFEFYGEALVGEERPGLFQGADSTDVNAYFLDALAGPRLRMARRDATPAGAPLATEFVSTLHVERNDIFLGNHRVGTYDVDHYYWCPSILWSGGPDAVREELIPLPGLATASALAAGVRVQLLGRTSVAAVTPDHRTVVEVNAAPVSDRTSDGFIVERHDIAGLPAATLTDPVRIGVRLPGVAGIAADRFELDWIEIDYPRRFEAIDGRLLFDQPGGARVLVTNLPTPDVTLLDVTDPLEPVKLTGVTTAPGTASAEIDAAAGGPHAIASHAAGSPTFVPQDIAWVPDPGLRDPTLDIDVLVIGPRAWLEPPLPALSRWTADRESQGLSVLLIPTETMVDEFADGWFTPFALSFLLAETFATWTGPPSYALLLGDANVDWKNQLQERNLQPTDCADFSDSCGFNELAWVQHVPTRMVDSPADQLFLGYFASDVALSMVVGGDLIPDVNLGRIPARTAAEAEMLLDRVLAYEALAAAPPPWASRILHVADEMGPSEGAMEGSLDEAYAEFVPAAYPRSTLFYQRQYGAMNPATFTNDLVSQWTDETSGPGILCYVGHGNTFRWSSDLLLGNRETFPACRNDVSRVTGPLVPQPFVLNANCISGGFMNLLGPSLLEELVRAEEGGAIAAFGPTGITDLALARTILDAFHAAVHGPDGRGLRLGDITFRIHAALAGNLAWDELLNNTLLGDPTLRLLVPAGPPALGLRAVAGDAVVRLDWDAVTGATDYRLYRSDTGAAGPWTELVTVSAGQLTHDDTTALNGRLYHYVLEPFDTVWPGRWSERVSARPCTPVPPEPPGAVNAVAQPAPGSFRLNWAVSPTPDLQRYVIRIYRGPVAAGPPEQVRTSNVSLANVTGLAPCGQYTFEVRSVSWCNVESLTGSTTFRVAQPCPVVMDPPAMISDLRVVRQGLDGLALAWSPVTATAGGTPLVVDHYRVHRADSPAFFVDLASEIGRPVLPQHPDPARVGSGASLEVYLVAAATAAGDTGPFGHDLPQGISGLQSMAVGADFVLTWTPVTRDIQGWTAPIARYHVFASATPLDRLTVVGRSPDLTVTVPMATIPQALGANHFILAEDVHGNLGAW